MFTLGGAILITNSYFQKFFLWNQRNQTEVLTNEPFADHYSVAAEVNKQVMNSDDQKPEGARHKNRTSFTPEQSRALEQGNHPVHHPVTFCRVYAQEDTRSSLSNQNFPRASTLICIQERNCQLKLNFLRTPLRYTFGHHSSLYTQTHSTS